MCLLRVFSPLKSGSIVLYIMPISCGTCILSIWAYPSHLYQTIFINMNRHGRRGINVFFNTSTIIDLRRGWSRIGVLLSTESRYGIWSHARCGPDTHRRVLTLLSYRMICASGTPAAASNKAIKETNEILVFDIVQSSCRTKIWDYIQDGHSRAQEGY